MNLAVAAIGVPSVIASYQANELSVPVASSSGKSSPSQIASTAATDGAVTVHPVTVNVTATFSLSQPASVLVT